MTLTLPAITGFLLSTGMAVDANVLVFERIKEEVRRGAHLSDAIDTGFSRAWSSIRDSNIATLVICLISVDIRPQFRCQFCRRLCHYTGNWCGGQYVYGCAGDPHAGARGAWAAMPSGSTNNRGC